MSSLNGEVILADQATGDTLQLRVFGDEFYCRHETLDGYTVIYDTQQRCYCYVTLAEGRFISSGIPVSKSSPQNLRKHLKEDKEVRNEKFSQRHSCIRSKNEEVESEFMRTLGSDEGLLNGRKLHQGNIRGLTVIVDFDDIRTNITTEDVDALFNSDNYSENGNYCSVKTYFETMSSGKLTYTNLVVGPVRLSKRRSHYINNLFIQEAMDIVVNDLKIDLKQFDSRNEGIVDAINFLYAGQSQYSNMLWPHNASINLRYGNMRTYLYQLTGLGQHKIDLRIGTICHENGHLLCRFPDMYDYGKRDGDHEKSQGIGRYCLMGSGNHLNQRRTPSPVCGYLRELAGWTDNLIEMDASGAYSLEHGDYNTILKFRTDKANEYFIVENRSNLGLDQYLPSSGLAILHCDTLGSNEWQEGTRNKHYQCALLQADGHLDLENNRNSGDDGDMFKAVEGIALSDVTTPSSREWDGTDSGLKIKDITAPNKVITFSTGTTPSPNSVHSETWPNLMIPDRDTKGISSGINISANGNVSSVSIGIMIFHSWISDLKVSLRSPSGTTVVLHNHEGNDGDDIIRTWTSDDLTELQKFHDEDIRGEWTLHVVDRSSSDVGRLLHWEIDMKVAPSAGGVVEDKATPKIEIADADPIGVTSTLPQSQSGKVKDIAVSVDIEHSYIGDLQVELVAPSGLTVLLHDREGAWRNGLNRSYDTTTTTVLKSFVNESISGNWHLRVRDLARSDLGQLNSWSLKIWY